MQLQYERPLVFFDLETTGISAPHDRIVELTAIRLQPDGGRAVWSNRMNPEMPIPKSATDVHASPMRTWRETSLLLLRPGIEAVLWRCGPRRIRHQPPGYTAA